ncbi:hypothetical protein T08_12673 [Trichinella sp. T8]|nr:hypothetical protein T08_12673 [Trichinella sp. T8]
MSSAPVKSTPTFTNGPTGSTLISGNSFIRFWYGGAVTRRQVVRPLSTRCAPALENPEPLPEGGMCMLHTCVQLPQMFTLDQQFSQT